MSEHVLLFGSGPKIDYGSLLRAHPGVRTSMMCRIEYLTKVMAPEGHQRVLTVRKDAPISEVVALARAIHAEDPITRVAAFWELDQDRAAAVGEALGLPTHSPDTVRVVNDKDAMRERLQTSGVDETAAALVRSAADITAFGAAHGYPVVVKPVAAAGSCGVGVVRSAEEAEAAYAAATGDFLGVTRAEVMVEQFHTGPQYSVEAFSADGGHIIVAVTRKYSDPHTLVELGHVCPAELDPADLAAIDGYIGDVLKVLGVDFGATHNEIVLTATGPRLIETHLRIGGDFIFELVREATGVDFIDLQVRQTLGEPVLEGVRSTLAAQRAPRHEAIWYAPPATGTLLGMTAPESVTMLHEPGTDLADLAGSWSRLAKARAHGATAEEAVAAAQDAIRSATFDIRVTPGVPPTV